MGINTHSWVGPKDNNHTTTVTREKGKIVGFNDQNSNGNSSIWTKGADGSTSASITRGDKFGYKTKSADGNIVTTGHKTPKSTGTTIFTKNPSDNTVSYQHEGTFLSSSGVFHKPVNTQPTPPISEPPETSPSNVNAGKSVNMWGDPHVDTYGADGQKIGSTVEFQPLGTFTALNDPNNGKMDVTTADYGNGNTYATQSSFTGKNGNQLSIDYNGNITYNDKTITFEEGETKTGKKGNSLTATTGEDGVKDYTLLTNSGETISLNNNGFNQDINFAVDSDGMSSDVTGMFVDALNQDLAAKDINGDGKIDTDEANQAGYMV